MAAGDTTITICGNLVDDPELKFTPNGHAVANFRVASTPRFFDKQANDWKDGESLFLTCTVWRQQAEHVAESLQRGHRVVVVGRLKQRSYETREGEKRTVYEVEAEDVAVSLKNATAKVEKAQRSGGGFGQDTPPAGRQGGQQDTYGGQGRGGRQSAPPADDPWATSGQQGGFADDPPF
jgi:single-strand DNA-binding protein